VAGRIVGAGRIAGAGRIVVEEQRWKQVV